MTVKELKAMVANMNDDAEVVFIYTTTDRDGWEEERTANIEKIETKEERYARLEAKAAERKAKANAWKEERIEELKKEIAKDNKLTKAAAKRNAERMEEIEVLKRMMTK